MMDQYSQESLIIKIGQTCFYRMMYVLGLLEIQFLWDKLIGCGFKFLSKNLQMFSYQELLTIIIKQEMLQKK